MLLFLDIFVVCDICCSIKREIFELVIEDNVIENKNFKGEFFSRRNVFGVEKKNILLKVIVLILL